MTRPKPVLLLILDGWGHRVERDDNAIAQAELPNWRAPAGRLPAHAGAHRRPPRRPAGRADGQLRSRAHEHRRRPHRLPGPDPHRRRDRGRQLRRATPSCSPPAPRPAHARRQRCTCSGCCRRAACTATSSTSCAMIALAATQRRAARRRARLPRWPRHAAALGRGQPARCSRRPAPRAGNARIATVSRPLLRDGPRPALGPRRTGLPGDHRSAVADCSADDAPAALAAAYARGENDEFVQADRDRRRRARSPTATPWCS